MQIDAVTVIRQEELCRQNIPNSAANIIDNNKHWLIFDSEKEEQGWQIKGVIGDSELIDAKLTPMIGRRECAH